jgi:hypothetical protein
MSVVSWHSAVLVHCPPRVLVEGGVVAVAVRLVVHNASKPPARDRHAARLELQHHLAVVARDVEPSPALHVNHQPAAHKVLHLEHGDDQIRLRRLQPPRQWLASNAGLPRANNNNTIKIQHYQYHSSKPNLVQLDLRGHEGEKHVLPHELLEARASHHALDGEALASQRPPHALLRLVSVGTSVWAGKMRGRGNG